MAPGQVRLARPTRASRGCGGRTGGVRFHVRAVTSRTQPCVPRRAARARGPGHAALEAWGLAGWGGRDLLAWPATNPGDIPSQGLEHVAWWPSQLAGWPRGPVSTASRVLGSDGCGGSGVCPSSACHSRGSASRSRVGVGVQGRTPRPDLPVLPLRAQTACPVPRLCRPEGLLRGHLVSERRHLRQQVEHVPLRVPAPVRREKLRAG